MTKTLYLVANELLWSEYFLRVCICVIFVMFSVVLIFIISDEERNLY